MVKRLREVKKWGNSLVVVLTSVDASDLKLEEGSIVNIDDLVSEPPIKKRGKKK